jgi:crotonobetainyl-CoA hydratase
MNEPLHIDATPPVLNVTINRGKANAIDAATSRMLSDVFAGFRDDPDLRVAIVTGAGTRFFSAGWDLGAAAGGEAFDDDFGAGGFGGFAELPGRTKPVIAAVNGMAVGGGFEMVLAADLVVTAGHAEFFLPEATLGIIADAGSVRLPKLLPRPLALELLLTGRRLRAAEARSWGLVNQVVTANELAGAARALADRVVAAAPLAVAATLDAVDRTDGMAVAEGLQALRSGQAEPYERMLASGDAREGPRAFAERRAPVWTGR